GARARAGLEEQVHDRLAAQQGHLLDGLFGDADEGLGGIENIEHHPPVHSFDGEQVAQATLGVDLDIVALHGCRCTVRARLSGLLNFTYSLGLRSMCSPTRSAWIGSSRPGRSTSTASCT